MVVNNTLLQHRLLVLLQRIICKTTKYPTTRNVQWLRQNIQIETEPDLTWSSTHFFKIDCYLKCWNKSQTEILGKLMIFPLWAVCHIIYIKPTWVKRSCWSATSECSGFSARRDPLLRWSRSVTGPGAPGGRSGWGCPWPWCCCWPDWARWAGWCPSTPRWWPGCSTRGQEPGIITIRDLYWDKSFFEDGKK